MVFNPPRSLFPATVTFENGVDGQPQFVLTMPGIAGLTSSQHRYAFESIGMGHRAACAGPI